MVHIFVLLLVVVDGSIGLSLIHNINLLCHGIDDLKLFYKSLIYFFYSTITICSMICILQSFNLTIQGLLIVDSQHLFVCWMALSNLPNMNH